MSKKKGSSTKKEKANGDQLNGHAKEATSPDPIESPPKAAINLSCATEDSQSGQLLRLTSKIELFRSSNGKAFATIQSKRKIETYPVRSSNFKMYLRHKYFREYRQAVNTAAFERVLGLLEAEALVGGEEHPVFVRVGERDGSFYLDLANARGEVVEISKNGWRILTASPVKFYRPPGMKPLPLPGSGRGGKKQFRSLLKFTRKPDFDLILAFLLAALRPTGPYPPLILSSEQGSGKSTISKILRALIDPNEAPVRGMPRDERDLMIAATHGSVIVLDNLSRFPEWLSNALCRLSTGGGFGTRRLYTDDEEILFNTQRPVILNGIEEIATRADILDRAIVVAPQIAKGLRKSEEKLWAEFAENHSTILAFLLDITCRALAMGDQCEPAELPRMADFVRHTSAAAPGLGWKPGYFEKIYAQNRRRADHIAIDASTIGRYILRIGDWSGTASQLFARINRLGTGMEKKSASWPKTPYVLSVALRRIVPNLRKARLKVTFSRSAGGNRERIITLKKIDQEDE